MSSAHKKYRVGELRPSQILYAYGIGSIIDLPHISTMVMGLDDWEIAHSKEIGEARLLQAVKAVLGQHVTKLLSPPAAQEQLDGPSFPFDESATNHANQLTIINRPADIQPLQGRGNGIGSFRGCAKGDRPALLSGGNCDFQLSVQKIAGEIIRRRTIQGHTVVL